MREAPLVQKHSSDLSLVLTPTKIIICDMLQILRLQSDCQTSFQVKKKKRAPVNKNVDANHIYSLVCDKSFTPYIRVLLKTSLILHKCLKIKCSTCVFYSCSTNVLQQSAGIQRSKRLTQTLQGGVSKLVSAKDIQD